MNTNYKSHPLGRYDVKRCTKIKRLGRIKDHQMFVFNASVHGYDPKKTTEVYYSIPTRTAHFCLTLLALSNDYSIMVKQRRVQGPTPIMGCDDIKVHNVKRRVAPDFEEVDAKSWHKYL